MQGALWTATIWTATLVGLGRSGTRTKTDRPFLRLSTYELAIISVLLGTHSVVGRTTAEEILANPVVGERILRLAFAGLGFLLVAPALRNGLRTAGEKRLRSMAALTAYVAVAAISILYSAAPLVTLGKAAELGAALSIAWAIVLSDSASDRFSRAVNLIVVLEGALVAVAVVGFFLVPDGFTSSDHRPGFLTRRVMASPFATSNTLAADGSLVAAYALASFFHAERTLDKAKWILWGLVGTAGMLFASGRQGLAIWVVAVAVLLFVHRRRLFLTLLLPLFAALVALNFDLIASIVTRDQSSTSLATLSSRLIFWKAGVQAWSQHPWTGYGFGVGGRFVALTGLSNTAGFHNGYVEALVGLGLLGVIPLVYAMWRGARWAVRTLFGGGDTRTSILIIPLLLHTSLSLGFGAWVNADVLLFFAIGGLADLWDERHRQQLQGNRSERLRSTPSLGESTLQ